MQNYKLIEEKLEQFIKKYYLNQLLRGSILFLSISLLFLLILLGLEYFLWSGTGFRLFLFWCALGILVGIAVPLILIPILKLFKISKGIDYEKASEIIGQHFNEVNDKLTNILQLKNQNVSNAFIAASIEQKSLELKPIKFQLAIDFKKNLKYAKFVIIPILMFIAIWISGQGEAFSESYTRILNYDKVYTPPAAFRINILNEKLEVIAGKDFLVKVKTEGKSVPEKMFINMNGKAFQMNKTKANQFEFVLNSVSEMTDFYLEANEVISQKHRIKVLQTPQITSFDMYFQYPKYLNKADEKQSGTGHAQLPEGTRIRWEVQTEFTDHVNFETNDTTLNFSKNQKLFEYQKTASNDFDYAMTTSNPLFKNHERLSYKINVIKDEFPEIKVQKKKDSLDEKQSYFYGQLNDDYGIQKLELVYRDLKTDSVFQKNIKISRNTYADFTYAFPNTDLKLQGGHAYSYYFKVCDNDAVNGSKSRRSENFQFRKLTQDEEKEDNLKRQKESFSEINKSLEKSKEEQKTLKELQQLNKEKSQLNYNDKEKIKQFLQRQKQQQEQMKKFSEKLKEDLQNLDDNSDQKQKLEERLESNQEQLEKNQKLIDELDKIKDKIRTEDLDKKLEEFDKSKQKQEKNLEQLLELTKRFYVEEKQKQLADKLKKLSEEQKDLSESQENDTEKQKDLSEKFEAFIEELDELEKQNQDLKSPMELGKDEALEEEVKEDQEDAEENLEKSETSEESGDKKDSKKEKQNASKKQKNAAEKMQQMSQKMQQSMSSMQMEQEAEDAEMLRQILNNLIIFSLQQEDLMEEFRNIENSNPYFAKHLRRQSELKENFKHIDDSLFALSQRNIMITESVNNKIEDINFNTEKALERLADNKVRRGTANQQYVMKDANSLANLLANALDQMQDKMSGSGSGQGKPQQGEGQGDQLSDIIKSHEELKKEMQKEMQKGQQEGQKKGEGKEGESGEKSGEQQGSESEDNQSGGEKKGSEGVGKNGKQKGNAEQMSSEIYEIFKRQQELRQELENRIKRLGLEDNSKELEKSLDELENELLMNGYSNKLLKQMEDVQHQLLKLKKAANQQSKEEKRQAETNTKTYDKQSEQWKKKSKEYFQSTEILNRQQLPLQTKYKELIKAYFNNLYD
ncbi:MAG: DUF4175 family protein [Psychroflexus halocasei]